MSAMETKTPDVTGRPGTTLPFPACGLAPGAWRGSFVT
jgi:hypothetical protein